MASSARSTATAPERSPRRAPRAARGWSRAAEVPGRRPEAGSPATRRVRGDAHSCPTPPASAAHRWTRTTPSIVDRPGWSGQAERARNGHRHDIGMGYRRQVDVVDTVGVVGPDARRDLDGEPRFACAARTGQVHEAVVDQQRPHVGHLCAAPDEAGQLDRKGGCVNRFWRFAAAGTRCGCRGGTAAQPARGEEGRAVRECRVRSARRPSGSQSTTNGSVAPESRVWPPWPRSRRRAVLLIVGPA